MFKSDEISVVSRCVAWMSVPVWAKKIELEGLGFGVSGFGFQVSGFGYWILGSGFGVEVKGVGCKV